MSSISMSPPSPVQTRFGTLTATHLVTRSRGESPPGTAAIPLHEIVSVRHRQRAYPGLGILLLLAAAACHPFLPHTGGVAALVALSLAGALLMWGRPTIVIRTVHGNTRRLRGMPWDCSEADRFVAALRAALFECRSH